MDTFAERLKSEIDRLDSGNLKAFARRCEAVGGDDAPGYSLLQKYLDKTLPGLDKAWVLSQVTGKPLEWLATGDNLPRNESDENEGRDTTPTESPTTPNDLAGRLRAEVERMSGGNVRDFEKRARHTLGSEAPSYDELRKFISGGQKPRQDQIIALARVIGRSPEWLEKGEEGRNGANVKHPPLRRVEHVEPEYRERPQEWRIPIVSRIAAGALIEQYAHDHPEEYLDPSEAGMVKHLGESLFGLRIFGDSMIGAGILDGDIAICSSVQGVEPGDIVAYNQGRTGKSTIKKLGAKNEKTRRITLIPMHPTMKPFTVDWGDGDQIKRVLHIWRQLRPPVDDPSLR